MAKSIIDIELKAEAFEKFAALFKKYNDQLSKMPGKWDKVGEAAAKSTESFDGAVEALNKASAAMENLVASQQKATETQSKFNKHVSSTEKSFGNIRKNIGGVLKDVTSTTAHLLKWAGIGGALGAVGMGGSLFGMATLAGGAGDVRRQAQGLGVSAGELKAANVNFSRYIDTVSTLGDIAQAQTDPSKRWAFSAAGVNPNQSAANALPQLLRKAAETYRAGPESTAAARLQARGFTELGISVSDARRLASLKEEELNTAVKRYSQDKKDLELNDSLLRKWQDLDVQLERSKQNIVNTFIDGLAPLVPDIEEFSEKLADAIKIFLSNPELKVWIKDFGEGIKYAAETLPEFVESIAKWIPGTKANQDFTKSSREAIWGKGVDEKMSGANKWAKDQWNNAINFFTGKGWTSQQAAGIVGNLQQESGMNPNAVNPTGHRGLAQWDSNRRRDFAAWSGKPIEMASMQEQLEFINYELTQGKERRAGQALSRATTVEQATSTFERTYERSGGSALEKRQGYANAAYAMHIMALRQNNVNLSIQNNTGGSATAVIGAAATPDLGYSALAGVR